MSDVVYIGRVAWVNENPDTHYRHARVEPLIRSSEEKENWLGPIEDAFLDFPGRGSVYWHNSPLGLAEGELKQFEIDEHPNYGGESDKDKYQVKNPKDILEIIDLRHIGSEKDIRILLQKNGVYLKTGPLGKRCMLWIEDHRWIGEINLTRVGNSNNWIFSPEQDLVSLKRRELPSDKIQSVEFDGTRYLLKPNYGKLGKHIDFVNWESNEDLAKRVFDRLLKRNRETATALGVAKKVFRAYMQTIDNAGLFGPQLEQELAFRQRVEEILETMTNNEELLDEAARVCFEVHPVKTKVEDRVEKEYQRLLAERKKQLESELSNEKDRLERATQNIVEKEKALASKKEELKALEEKLQKQIERYETELNKRLLELSKTPERMFAEMSIVKAMTPQKDLEPVTPVEITSEKLDVPIIRTLQEFLVSLNRHLLKSGMSPEIGLSLYSSLLAGTVPVLIGPQAYEAILAYSKCISGGTLHWITIGGGVFEPSDILARYDLHSRCLLPHPGGLLDLLLDQSETIKIVVLEGFNRGSVDGYLIPLLQLFQDVMEKRPPRYIPLAPASFPCDTNPYQGVYRISWNRNVLLMLIPSAGSAALPVPKEIWEYCSIIDTWTTLNMDFLESQKFELHTSRVKPKDWNDWGNSSFEIEIGDSVKLPDMTKDNPCILPPSVLNNFLRVFKVGVSIGMKKEDSMERALELAFRSSLQPYLVATEENLEDWFRLFGINMESVDQRISDAIRNFGE